jgi:hypothetical protein
MRLMRVWRRIRGTSGRQPNPLLRSFPMHDAGSLQHRDVTQGAPEGLGRRIGTFQDFFDVFSCLGDTGNRVSMHSKGDTEREP